MPETIGMAMVLLVNRTHRPRAHPSLDAFVIASLNGPDEAFRFAKGEPAHSSLNNAEETRLSRPLDFAAVTEHSEWLGEYGLIVGPATGRRRRRRRMPS